MAASQKDIERLKKLRRMGQDKSIPESARERFMDEAAGMEYEGYEKSKGMKCGGKVKKMAMGGFAASKMGKVKTAAPSRDGVAAKGKTKGKMITMRKGGKAC